MKKTLLCVLFCLMGCFLFSACVPPAVPEPYGIMQPTDALFVGLDQLKPQAVSVQTSTLGQESYYIVVDDGFGMKGFIAQHCTSYRAAISAVTSIGINRAHVTVRASELINESNRSLGAEDTFFQDAIQEQFFREKSNDISSVITAMANNYQQNSNQVMILVSDLMIPTEDDCMKAAAALYDAVLKPERSTLGLIGIVGDFRGSIENLPVSPTTGYKRKLSDYMVLQREENGSFRHPLYILFMGNDQAVLSAMQKALTSLENGGMLDESTPHYALYFSEYDAQRRVKDDIYSTFNLGCQDYNRADYQSAFLVRGIENEDGKILYPASMRVADEYQQLMKDIPITMIYDAKRGNTEKNVRIRCTVPFDLSDSSENGASIADKHRLLVPAEKVAISKEDYSISAEIKILEYVQKDPAKPTASWIEPDAGIVRVESATLDKNSEKIEVVLSVNTGRLSRDVPLLCSVGIRVTLTPQWESISALYDTTWIEELTLNLKEFDQESVRQELIPTSARYTYATTAKTPYLANLFSGGVAEQQIELIRTNVREKTGSFVQTTLFGIVVRDMPVKYIDNYSWESTESFGGWAFSVKEVEIIRAAID